MTFPTEQMILGALRQIKAPDGSDFDASGMIEGLSIRETPQGAQIGFAIAVDPQSIPYGTPVWLASSGDSLSVARLMMAQDTGAAIKGAVRADYFVGSGDAAGELAGRLKQPLQLWVLWPK